MEFFILEKNWDNTLVSQLSTQEIHIRQFYGAASYDFPKNVKKQHGGFDHDGCRVDITNRKLLDLNE
jgi:hypothetical protein